jgi:hypothetical protein
VTFASEPGFPLLALEILPFLNFDASFYDLCPLPHSLGFVSSCGFDLSGPGPPDGDCGIVTRIMGKKCHICSDSRSSSSAVDVSYGYGFGCDYAACDKVVAKRETGSKWSVMRKASSFVTPLLLL